MDSIVSRTLSVHKEHELLLKLEKAGLSEKLAQRVIDSKDNDLASKIIRLVRNNGLEIITSQTTASKIMGSNFFGIEEAAKYFDINPKKEQLAFLASVPFSEAILEQCKETHILAAVFPLSIFDIREKFEKLFYAKRGHSAFDGQRFLKDWGEIGWQLVRKTPVDDSFSKKWAEQQKLIDHSMEEVPTAQALVYVIVGHCLVTEKFLFNNIFVRTSTLCSDNHHVGLGVTSGVISGIKFGVNIYNTCDYKEVGVSSAMKS